MKIKLEPTALLILGTINFLIFAYDIEYDKDYWTWVWLLTSEIYFLGWLRYWINENNQNN